MVETAERRSCSTNWRLVCETNLKLGEHAVMVQPVLTQVVLAINEGVNLRELRLPFLRLYLLMPVICSRESVGRECRDRASDPCKLDISAHFTYS